MKQRLALLFLLFSVVLSFPAYAHPGSLDENGGHYDYSTGEYHYHHGYPAHGHPAGLCRYNYHDNTDDDYSPSFNNDYSWMYTVAPRPSNTAKPQVQRSFFQKHPVLITVVALVATLSVWITVSTKREKERERARQLQFEKEKQEAIEFYASHDLRTLSKMPDIYYVDEKLVPYEFDKPNGYTYGATLDVYISRGRSDVYHARGCIHLAYLPPKNIYSDNLSYYLRARRPCSICKPQGFPDIKWYSEYLSHIHTCEKYGIKPVQNPVGFSPPSPKVFVQPKQEPKPLSCVPPVSSTPSSHHPDTPHGYSTILPQLASPTQVSHPISVQKQITTALEPEPTEGDIPNILLLYRTKYPKTWRYLQNLSKDPENYVCYYHHIWGRLQEYHGDGIIYGTLSDEEQSFVDYPSVGESVYLSSEKSKSYHSTPECYSLLRSTPIKADAIHAIVRERCTKCVPPRK